MSVEGILSAGRTAALQLMRDTCTVERKTGAPVFDDSTGQYVQEWAPVHSGQCRVKPRSHSEAEFGEREVTLHSYIVVLPWDATPEIHREDRLTVTASDDAWLIGRPLEVIDVGYAGTATARRLVVEDNST
ncbi:DUF6093 family protein [Streptosporangium canum]|uniref:DUF6093 family protein n=1 Tax=Streptosporangium canum TaxID=324952 RepID=UPI0034326071